MTGSTTITDVEAELDKRNASKTSTTKNIVALVISIGLFVAAGLIRFSVPSLAVLVVVVFIHELGHAIGMKIFGYRDLKMFFIPFFGAAVSGKEKNPNGTERALVILLGPAPGIILGLIAMVLSGKLQQPLLMTYAKISVGINLFNLIPAFPLDGGRFLEAILFSRSLFLEIVFRLLAVVVMAALAWYLSSILLGVLAFFALVTVREIHFTSKMAGSLKNEILPDSERIPHEQLERIMPELGRGLSGKNLAPSMLASRAQNIWNRARLKSPGIVPSLALLACYGAVILTGLFASLIFAYASRQIAVVERFGPDGKTVSVQETRWYGHKLDEAQLDRNGNYDGPYLSWNYRGIKEREGDYREGFKDGEWKYYDSHGEVAGVAVFEKGAAVLYRRRADLGFDAVSREEWPAAVRRVQAWPVVSEARDPRDWHWILRALKARLVSK